MVVAYDVCGNRNKALASLERVLHAGLPLDEVKGDPGLRADVRYHRLIAKLARKS